VGEFWDLALDSVPCRRVLEGVIQYIALIKINHLLTGR
jgi:hypothetical protein